MTAINTNSPARSPSFAPADDPAAGPDAPAGAGNLGAGPLTQALVVDGNGSPDDPSGLGDPPPVPDVLLDLLRGEDPEIRFLRICVTLSGVSVDMSLSNITIDRARIEQAGRDAIQALKDHIKKCEHEERAKRKAHGVMGILKNVATVTASLVCVCAAAAATYATGGAAAPMLVMSLYAFQASVTGMASDLTGKDVTLGGGLTTLFKKWGADDNLAGLMGGLLSGDTGRAASSLTLMAGGSEKDAMIAGLTISTTTAVVMIAVSFGTSSAGSAAQGAQNMAKLAETARTMQVAGTVVSGVAGGSISIAQGVYQLDAADAVEASAASQAHMQRLQAALDLLQELLAFVVDAMRSAMQTEADLIETASNTSRQKATAKQAVVAAIAA